VSSSHELVRNIVHASTGFGQVPSCVDRMPDARHSLLCGRDRVAG
jgi:hypothetical protein